MRNISMPALIRVLVATLLAAGTFGASAAPYAVDLHYTTQNGYTATGTAVFNYSLLTPNNHVEDLGQLTSASITISGAAVPGGHQTFTQADLTGWYLTTGNTGNIIDLNFFMDAPGSGCYINGVEVFLLGIICDGTSEAVVELTNFIPPPPPPVPALAPAGIGALSLLTGLLALASLQRRRTRAARQN